MAVEPLIKVLDDNDVKNRAFISLVEIGTGATEAMIIVLNDRDPQKRMCAARILGKIADPRAVEPLIKSLNKKSPSVQKYAAQALGEIADPRAVEPLIKSLNDKSPSVQKYAAKALSEIGDPRAVEPLIRASKGICQEIQGLLEL